MYMQQLKRRLIILITLFVATNIATAQLVAAPENAAAYKTVVTDTGNKFTVYVAGPQSSKYGLLLLHGWLGLNREMETWANQFAVAGFRVMAIDLYNGEVAVSPVTARKLMNKVVQKEANSKFKTAIAELGANGRKVAIIGRSYGANQSIQAAAVGGRNISAVVLYYPFGEVARDESLLTTVHAPVLGNFATDDFFFGEEKERQLVVVARKKSVNLTIEHYQARHDFANLLGNNFNQDAEKAARVKTLSFIETHLR